MPWQRSARAASPTRLVQHASGNPAEDFHAYALERLARCEALMASDGFEAHVAAVRAG